MVSNGRARAAVVSALSVAAQYQRVWGFTAVPPLPRISQPQHSSDSRLHAGDEYEEQGLSLSRADLLRLIPPGVFGALVVGAAANPSSAALPTTEDYAFGTGSKVNTTAMRCSIHVRIMSTRREDYLHHTRTTVNARAGLGHRGLCAGVACLDGIIACVYVCVGSHGHCLRVDWKIRSNDGCKLNYCSASRSVR